MSKSNIIWFTQGIKASCKRKRELYLMTNSNVSASFIAYYKKYCKILNKVVTAAKKMAYDHYCNKTQNKMKSTWKSINIKTGRTTIRDDIQYIIGKCCDQNVAETINEYFLSLADSLTKSNFGNTSDMDYLLFMEHAIKSKFPKICIKPVTTEEIERIIYSFKTKDSCGYDQISLRVLKLSTPYMSLPLNYICNKIMQHGIFPERLKYSVINPLYKEGDKELISNHRPISLLTSFSKIVEKVMFNRLINNLKKYAILSPSQYGFQKNLSTDNTVYALLSEILTALNNKSRAKGIFCDIEKSFDCVNHDVLLHKLEICGATGSTKELFSQFLTNRYQRVNLKDTRSGQTPPFKWSKVKHGVPQGSVLGPLLFLLYINDFPLAIDRLSTPILFADDTSLVVTDRNPANIDAKLNTNLQIVFKWFKSNKLSINFSKTYCMQFKTKKYYIN
jgi:hypothetical protein